MTLSDTTEYWNDVKAWARRPGKSKLLTPEQESKKEERREEKKRKKERLWSSTCVCGCSYRDHGRAVDRKYLRTDIPCKRCVCMGFTKKKDEAKQ